jgi:hypothetical protein
MTQEEQQKILAFSDYKRDLDRGEDCAILRAVPLVLEAFLVDMLLMVGCSTSSIQPTGFI